jgi:microcystin-dependent protein
MSEAFLGEIRMFAGSVVPNGWRLCDGATLGIQANQALFSLLATTYGGDGQTTFALPDLRGRTPIAAGTGPGLSGRTMGQPTGTETVTLTVAHLPVHTHALSASTAPATLTSPTSGVPAVGASTSYRTSGTPVATGMTLPATGGGASHENMQPFLTISFIIAVTGIFPSQA